MTIVDECAFARPSGRNPKGARLCLPEGKEQITLWRWEGFELGVPSQRRAIMYKRIVLAVDLADQAPSPKGLEQALELTKASGGELSLVNVQPVIPATFME